MTSESLKSLDMLEQSKSFKYYKPKNKSMMKKVVKTLKSKHSSNYAFTNCLLDDNDHDSSDEIQTFIIPINGGGESLDIKMPPSKIEESIRNYVDKADKENHNYKVKKLRKGLNSSRQVSSSRDLLNFYRSPRFIEKH